MAYVVDSGHDALSVDFTNHYRVCLVTPSASPRANWPRQEVQYFRIRLAPRLAAAARCAPRIPRGGEDPACDRVGKVDDRCCVTERQPMRDGGAVR